MRTEVANRIKHYRASAGLSQHQLARRIGATQGLVSHWENGRQLPSPEMAVTLERISAGELPRAALRPDLFKEPCHAP